MSEQQDELAEFNAGLDLALDEGIAKAVMILRRGGIETYESCEGGPGHAFTEPTVRFSGNAWEGHKAFAIAMEHDLPVFQLHRAYSVVDGELSGPVWEIVFRHKV
jgi:hypothetical protein